MSQNDMELIMYKILRYLYDCEKEGKRIREEDFNHESRLIGGIPETYWQNIIMELHRGGYVDGIRSFGTKSGRLVDASEARITFSGVQFLKENSRMKEAGKFAGKAFEVLLSSIITAII